MPLYNPQDVAAHSALKTGIHGIQSIPKTINEDVVSSTALQNDDELFVVVGANEVWEVFAYIRFLGASTDPDIKCDFTVPVAGSFLGFKAGKIGQLTNDFQSIVPTDLVSTFEDDGLTTEKIFVIWGIYIGGANAGNLQFRFAQKISDADYIRVLANSFIRAHRLS